MERIRDSMQKPIEDLSPFNVAALNKEGDIIFPSTTVLEIHSAVEFTQLHHFLRASNFTKTAYKRNKHLLLYQR